MRIALVAALVAVFHPVTDLRIATGSLSFSWTAPVCADRSPLCSPAGVVETALLYVHRKTGPRWWEQAAVIDTVRFAAGDGQRMSYLAPLWWDYGTVVAVSRDAAGNWSPHSNYVESKNP